MGRRSQVFLSLLFVLLGLLALPVVAQDAISTTVYVLKEGNQLSTVPLNNLDAATEPVSIAGIGEDDDLVAIDVRPQNQKLYALGVDTTANSYRLYLLSFAGTQVVATPVGQSMELSDGESTIDVPMTTWAIDFDPVTDQLRVVNADRLNFRINPSHGSLIDGSFISGINPDQNIAADTGTPEVNGIAYTNNQPNSTSGTTTLYSLDTDEATLNIQVKNINDASDSGEQTQPLPVYSDGEVLAFTGVGGFDFPPGVNTSEVNESLSNGVGYAVLSTEDNSRLYRLNINSNLVEAESLGDLTAISIAIRTTLSTAVGLSADRLNLVRFNPFGSNSVSVPITGIVSGETVVALDMHPLTGQLLALGLNSTNETGTLYTIDLQTGESFSRTMPSQSYFTEDNGGRVEYPAEDAGWAMDINPVTGHVRIICGSFNARLDSNGFPVDGDFGSGEDAFDNVNRDGVTVIDDTTANILGIAHTTEYDDNSALVTTLYALSGEENSLFLMDTGNLSSLTNGVFINGNGLSIPSVSSATGFDISTSSSVGFVSFSEDQEDTLYQMNLTTGIVSLLRSTPTLSNLAILSISEAPTVVITAEASNVTSTRASLSGSVTEDGGETVTERGFVYLPASFDTTPVLGEEDVSVLTQDDFIIYFPSFALDAGDLTPETSYVYRAYAKNDAGVSYSSLESFTTSVAPSIEFTDVAVGGEYNFNLELAEGSTATAKGLPPGLKLNSRTGIITGRTSTPGVYQVVITVKDADNVKTTTIETFTVQALPTTSVGTFVAYVDRPEESSVTSGLGRLDVKTTAKGSFTVKLTRASRALSGKGFLESNLVDAPILKTTLSDGTRIELSLRGENTVEGGVFVGETAANVVGWRKTYDRLLAPATEQMGYYTVYMQTENGELDANSVPQGHGFAAITIGLDGSYKLVGKAADGSPVTTAAFLGSNGQMMVFTSLYKKQGSISAFLQFQAHEEGSYTDNSIDGTLYLNKPVTPGRAYPAAFPHLQLSVQGMYMARAATGGLVLGLPSTTGVSSLAFRDGGIGSSLLDPSLYGLVNFSATTQKATVPPLGGPFNPTRTTLNLKASNGSLTGNFKLVDGPLKRTVKYQGLLVRTENDTIGRGYFLLPQVPVSGQTAKTSPILSGRVELVNGGLESF